MPNHDVVASPAHALAHHALAATPPVSHVHGRTHPCTATRGWRRAKQSRSRAKNVLTDIGPGLCCKTMTFGASARVRSGTSPARAQNIAAALHPCFATECTACWVWWVVRRRFQHHFALCGLLRAPHAARHAANASGPCCPRHLASMPMWKYTSTPSVLTHTEGAALARTHAPTSHAARHTRNLLAFSYPRMN